MAALVIQTWDDLKIAPPALVSLPDGASVLIRPAVPSDGERLQRMFYRLSPETIYRWCFLPVPSLPHWAQTLANVANVDYQQQYAMVASVNGEIIGIARYDYNPTSQEAEFGIVIEDTWQARGLGKLLLSYVIIEARRRQIARFTALILGDNRPALRLAPALFEQYTTHWEYGQCQVSGSLDSFKPPAHIARLISAKHEGA